MIPEQEPKLFKVTVTLEIDNNPEKRVIRFVSLTPEEMETYSSLDNLFESMVKDQDGKNLTRINFDVHMTY